MVKQVNDFLSICEHGKSIWKAKIFKTHLDLLSDDVLVICEDNLPLILYRAEKIALTESLKKVK